MILVRVRAALILLAYAGCTTSPGHGGETSSPSSRARRWRDGVFVSDALPALRLTPGPGLRYLGAHPFRIDAIAEGERHVFVESAGGRVRRMLVLQFEGILPTSTEEYRYPITNPVELGGVPYRHSVHFYRVSDSLRESPQGELALTVKFLEEKRLTLPDEQAMSRYARVIGADKKHELLIFYHESLADWGKGSVTDLAIEEGPRPEAAPLVRAVAERALASFRIF